MPYYDVTIPYYHRFTVEARDPTHALEVAHNEGGGSIIGYSDEDALVELTSKPGTLPRKLRKGMRKPKSAAGGLRGVR